MNVLNEIKTIGVKLSVDDFGTGYSSLSYLRNIPLDTIKIDKSFIDDIVTHTDHAPIVASIITLAKNLNLKVVAEGVETLEQVKYLSLRECDEIQGYYFSSPVNQVNFERMLTAQCKKNNS
jgi:EAL domain-containing protein (putative c-di-GMP-specific phosphodiesterase class I)